MYDIILYMYVHDKNNVSYLPIKIMFSLDNPPSLFSSTSCSCSISLPNITRANQVIHTVAYTHLQRTHIHTCLLVWCVDETKVTSFLNDMINPQFLPIAFFKPCAGNQHCVVIFQYLFCLHVIRVSKSKHIIM